MSLRRKQVGETLQQIPKCALGRPSVRFILFELSEGEAPGTRAFPSLFSRAQEAFDENRTTCMPTREC